MRSTPRRLGALYYIAAIMCHNVNSAWVRVAGVCIIKLKGEVYGKILRFKINFDVLDCLNNTD